ncbi:hypothetical protein M413DRAFT_14735 [Hebeloma cylindrosporum]|uniref:Uncharacterized protein n=1 Tax=Hebeloma cylindrosporum TaxID=76867 RepID=A0A0C3BUT2_HEBCY|nr:hypothetical protein M413DRAFT_14735 [Hebeloma cylindrosporum h7]
MLAMKTGKMLIRTRTWRPRFLGRIGERGFSTTREPGLARVIYPRQLCVEAHGHIEGCPSFYALINVDVNLGGKTIFIEKGTTIGSIYSVFSEGIQSHTQQPNNASFDDRVLTDWHGKEMGHTPWFQVICGFRTKTSPNNCARVLYPLKMVYIGIIQAT